MAPILAGRGGWRDGRITPHCSRDGRLDGVGGRFKGLPGR
jgi:hypothetical protein